MATDGSANAATGAAQLPNLLNGYAVRPPWQVAGVDYAVGVNSGTALKSPMTMNMAGVWVDKTNKIVGVSGDNVVLDGWNFSGWTVSVLSGAENTTVTNSNFTEGVLRFEPGSKNGTIKYNLFDQNDKPVATAPFIVFASGTFVVEYNHFQESYHMHAQFTNGQPGQTVIFQYNLLENAGGGAPDGAHGDWIQFFGGYTIDNAQINYNTAVQNKSGFSTQGWQLGYSDLEVRSASISNNTMVVPSVANASVNYAVILNRHEIIGTVIVQDNYIDQRGVHGSFLLTNDNEPGPYNGTINTSNIVNMVTGGYIYPPSGTAAPVITAFSTDTGVAGDNITSDNTVTLSGTAAANSTVKVYDGTNLLGQVTANGSGVWSYTTALLSDGSHSFAATATSGSTTSPASAARIITVDTVAPGAPAIASLSSDTGTVGDGITSDNTLTLTGTAAANSAVKVYNDTTLLGTVTANSGGAWTYTTAALPNGLHTFTATASDVAGNTSVASSALNVTVTAAVADDFNGGGTSDILWHNGSGGLAQFKMNNGMPTWAGIGTVGAGWEVAGTGDFNGDGTSDILWHNGSGGLAQFKMNNGMPTWAGIGTVGASWEVAGTGDFNGDGTSDILWHNGSGGLAQFKMNNGMPTWAGIGTVGAGWEVAGTGDFNGDGTSDILLHNGSGGLAQFKMNNGTPTWAGIGTVGAGWEVAGTGDFNGNGTSDILLYNASSGGLAQFKMNNGMPTWAGIGTVGAGWEVAGTGDFNGDGTSDILLYNASSGGLTQFEMNNGMPTWAGIGTAGPGWVLA